MNKINNLK